MRVLAIGAVLVTSSLGLACSGTTKGSTIASGDGGGSNTGGSDNGSSGTGGGTGGNSVIGVGGFHPDEAGAPTRVPASQVCPGCTYADCPAGSETTVSGMVVTPAMTHPDPVYTATPHIPSW